MEITKDQFYLLQDKVNEIYEIAYSKNRETVKIESSKLRLQLEEIERDLIALEFFCGEVKTVTINDYILGEISYLYKAIIND
ncbi:Phage exonuclease [Yersinia phage fPS-2]|uniref:Phage exonuclease n=1 Tax=Yersinia phage fPS-2 TaxID=2052930 RepID=A0A449C5J0_9CAUD|nr:dextranase [Yersinia phage fPS-2]VEV89629.1 Phage exonuclease [Yersinia phage fPS-2]